MADRSISQFNGGVATTPTLDQLIPYQDPGGGADQITTPRLLAPVLGVVPNVIIFTAPAYGGVGDARVYTDGSVTGVTHTSATATFTSDDVDKTVVIAGAGIGGVPYVTTIASVETSISCTLANSVPTNVGSGAYCVLGTPNDTALDDAFTAMPSTGATLVIPPGQYLFTDGNHTLPAGCNIDTLSQNCPLVAQYSAPYVAPGTINTNTAGTFFDFKINPNGVSFFLTDRSSNAFLNVDTNSTVSGLLFYWPMQSPALASPIVYPFAIQVTGYHPCIQNCNLVNPYRGIKVIQDARTLIERIRMEPLSVGIHCVVCEDNTTLRDVIFGTDWSQGSGNAATWRQSNSWGIFVEGAAQLTLDHCFMYYGNRWLQLSKDTSIFSTGVSPYVQIIGCGADTLHTGINIDGLSQFGPNGVIINGFTYAAALQADDRGIAVNLDVTGGSIDIIGWQSWNGGGNGNYDFEISPTPGSRIHFSLSNSILAAGAHGGGIYIDGDCNVSVSNCDFAIAGKPQVNINSGAANVTFMGNFCKTSVNVVNGGTGTVLPATLADLNIAYT